MLRQSHYLGPSFSLFSWVLTPELFQTLEAQQFHGFACCLLLRLSPEDWLPRNLFFRNSNLKVPAEALNLEQDWARVKEFLWGHRTGEWAGQPEALEKTYVDPGTKSTHPGRSCVSIYISARASLDFNWEVWML